MNGLVRAQRAFLSVWNKTNLIGLAEALTRFDIELVSTGGTKKHLEETGLKIRDVSDLTGFPEMMDGRLKTLHPRVHGGLLAIRDKAEHKTAMEIWGILPIDILAVNLYPFKQTVASGADYKACVENIDIGGPAMIRAAAKNHEYVCVMSDPEDYKRLLQELQQNNGSTTFTFRKEMAADAFRRTSAYDLTIAHWFQFQL